ncbi:MAG: hypothetical protein GY925_25075 [Actinomycetia bacterium]|nr:hypothetical protein [Actinomycetes bacterium]
MDRDLERTKRPSRREVPPALACLAGQEARIEALLPATLRQIALARPPDLLEITGELDSGYSSSVVYWLDRSGGRPALVVDHPMGY